METGGQQENNMKNISRNTFYWIIPVFCLVIIFQAVVLVNSTLNQKTTMTASKSADFNDKESQAKLVPEVELGLVTTETEWKIGKKYKVTFEATSRQTRLIDAMDLYVKYDKDAFTVSNLLSGDGLPKPTSSKISTKTGLLVANIYIPVNENYKMEKAVKKTLLTFEVTPKKLGDFTFEIDTGKVVKESVTMIVESKTAKVLPFAAEMLAVKVIK